jgi:eukaryotic-like serine/threonine-protein kinase
MATQTTSVRDYYALLKKSKLLPADEVEGLYKRWHEETGGADDQVEQFRKFLVGRRALTEYQAALIQRGRADNFFLGEYKILDRVGKGQMGGVYKAVHALGQIVALKILPASRAKNSHTLGRFQREARLLTQFDHPNVVRAFQVGEANGVHYIVMEFLEGETLDEMLTRRKRLPWAEAVRLVHQALGGLQHLHERRAVHRDLKPANLMLTPAAEKPDTTWGATVKILDIGLGREMFDENTPEGQVETQLTIEGAVLGTPDYLAPEQAKDAASADTRADIYSLGCVLYHCLTGRPPFTETNLMAQMFKHATEKPAPLASLAPDVPPALQVVLDGMLAKRPGDRYPTPADAAEALKPFLGTGGVPAAPAAMVPAFKAWLETESGLDIPIVPAPAPTKPAPSPVKSGGTAPAFGATAPAKPGTASAPALGATARPGVAPGTAPAPALSGSTPAKPGPAPGTAPAPALGAPRPTAPTRSTPARPVAPPRRVVEEVDVELVPEPLPGPEVLPLPDEPEMVKAERGLLEFDRRDWIMLAAGAAGVLVAVGVGYGLARLVRKKPEEPPPEE